jgi:hypothetical protein
MTPAYRCLLSGLTIATALLCLVAGCSHPSVPHTPSAAAKPEVWDQFVGSDACSSCHPDEALHHSRSGHARTLRQMDSHAVMPGDPPAGAIRNTDLAVRLGASGFVVRNQATRMYFPLTLAFGSGQQGITYATALDNATLFEMHYSYFPAGHKWYVTPGHEHSLKDRKALGMNLTGGVPRACILCHATTLPENSLRIDPKFMGVGCESCHGPAGAHVAAVKTPGAKDLHIANLAALGGAKMNVLCGKCHRTVEETQKMPVNQRITQRFFPYALAMSRCFQESGDRLSCITCHDPHADVSRDMKAYEARCLSCHAPHANVKSVNGGQTERRPNVCRINPRSGCIPCHMPRRDSFPGTSLPILMADHWIRVRKQ